MRNKLFVQQMVFIVLVSCVSGAFVVLHSLRKSNALECHLWYHYLKYSVIIALLILCYLSYDGRTLNAYRLPDFISVDVVVYNLRAKYVDSRPAERRFDGNNRETNIRRLSKEESKWTMVINGIR
jgi:hypothetical protein